MGLSDRTAHTPHVVFQELEAGTCGWQCSVSRRLPAQFGQLGCPTTEQAATLQESSPSPVGTPGDRAEGIPTWPTWLKNKIPQVPSNAEIFFFLI